MKTDYEALSGDIQALYYRFLDIEEKLRSTAKDLSWDEENLTCSSESSRKQAWAWFEKEKARAITEGGWTLEEFEAAEKAETEAWYASLEATPLPEFSPIEVLHDEGPEPESNFDWPEPPPEPAEEPVDLDEVEICPACKCYRLVGERCWSCEELHDLELM